MNARPAVLATGGAGYIGSHVLLQLVEAGYEPVVYDNLSTGYQWAVGDCELVVGDLSDLDRLAALFESRKFDAVVHFAAHLIVPESVTDPLKYYRNNTANTLGLLELCDRYGVDKFVFSSTTAVYGIPDRLPITEDMPVNPISPYGASKMMSERFIMDLASASSLRYVILRYFNVAGADPEGRIGQATPDATHLIKVACEAAVGSRPGMTIFGDDFPTRDGTGVRDYIHVSDLARAHVDALDYLRGSGDSAVLNCGYGRGYSVTEVVDAVKRISGVDFPVEIGARRDGDPPELIAGNERIKQVLGWAAKHDDLDVIVRTAFDWETRMAREARTLSA